MSEFVFCSLGAVRRDLIRCVARESSDMSHLLLDGADGPAEISRDDGELIIEQLRGPTPKPASQVFAANTAVEVVRPGKMFTAPNGFSVEPNGKLPAEAQVDVSVSPAEVFRWRDGGPPEATFRLRVDADGESHLAVLPHHAAQLLVRELESYLKLHG